jgi:2'-5' RNA ligase
VPEFFLPLKGAGSFGGSRPSVVWIGVGRGHPHLFALHHHIQDAVLRCGLEADLKPFHPHVTVGRAKDVSRAALRPFLQQYAEEEFGLWKVTEFILYSSRLSSAGSDYRVEFQQPLARAE